jgi:hypothetical protein
LIMETALSTITVLPSDKLELAMFTRKIKSEILANDRDPLLILKQLKFVEKLIKDLLTDKELDDHFLNEAEKYKEKTFEHVDCKFTVAETGVKYDYNATGDPVWFDLNKQITNLEANIKVREKFLQNAGEGFVEPNSGVFVNTPPRTSKTKVTVTIR